MPHLTAQSGVNWHYDCEGQGEALLFLHGWSVDKRVWRQQSKYFSHDYQVLTIDLPGHGESSWQLISLEQMAMDVKEILEFLKIKEVSIIGSSMGGLLGLKSYEISPQLIKSLVFVGSMPKFVESADYPYGLKMKHINHLANQVERSYPSIINIFFRSVFTIEERSSRRFKWLQKFRRYDSVPTKEALAAYLEILQLTDLRFVLKNVRKPVLFISGEGDPICDVKTVLYLKNFVPQAMFFDFKACGHFPFLSKPHEFNQVLKDFLQ